MIVPQKILIIRFSSIGDIVLATPLLRVLHARFPSSQIDFIVRKEYAELVRCNKNLHSIYEFDVKTGFSGLRKLKNQLRVEHYDLIVDIHNSLRSRYLRMLMGLKNIVIINKHIITRMMLVKFKVNFYRKCVSISDRYIETLKNFGVQNDNAGLELYIPDEIRAVVDNKMAALKIDHGKKIIGFCPSAKHATKCWPQERFTALGRALVKEYDATILLFGGAMDYQKCKSICDEINTSRRDTRAINMGGELSLLENAAAMQFCNLIVTNDSGLMHIAAAMKRKVITIFGPSVREFGFFPVGTESVIVERTGLYCRPCSHIGRSTCPENHFRCMNEISIEDVAEAIKHLEIRK